MHTTISGIFVVSNGPWSVAPHSRLTFNQYPTTNPSLRDYLRAEGGRDHVLGRLRRADDDVSVAQCGRASSEHAIGARVHTREPLVNFVGIPTGGSWQNRIYFFNSANANNTIHLTYRDHL